MAMSSAGVSACLVVGQASWGLMSVVEAERKLLDAALRDPSNTHFILVSES